MKAAAGTQPAEVVQRFLDREGLSGKPILVAVSGGPDSTALLHILRQLTTVAAAHLNHQLRGAESDADEQFVTGLCQQMGVPLQVARRNVAEEATQSHCNLEAHARAVRYQWLDDTARRLGFGLVATGHTLNDQAETVLFHVLRGTGLRGLRGIAPRRPLSEEVEVIRPLLQVRRSDLLAYLQVHQLPFREDSSNRDERFTRNWIRNELLPWLQARLRREVVGTLAGLAEEARELLAEQQQRVQTTLQRAEKPRVGEMVILDVVELSALSPCDLVELFCGLWEREGWPRGRLSRRHWRMLVALVAGEGKALCLPGGVQVRRCGRVLQLCRHRL